MTTVKYFDKIIFTLNQRQEEAYILWRKEVRDTGDENRTAIYAWIDAKDDYEEAVRAKMEFEEDRRSIIHNTIFVLSCLLIILYGFWWMN
jgi:hypothetical protein